MVDDRALAGICESRDKESEGRTMKDIDAWRWCLLKNTERKATGNHLSKFPKNTDNDDGKRSGVIGSWNLPKGRELKEEEAGSKCDKIINCFNKYLVKIFIA